MKRTTKKMRKAQEAFRQRVMSFLEEVGAEHTYSYPELMSDEYVLDTPAGRLSIHVYDDWIAQRFAEPKRGVTFTKQHCSQTCNPFSGKWNFHYFEGVTEDGCERYWRDRIEVLLSCDPIPECQDTNLMRYVFC